MKNQDFINRIIHGDCSIHLNELEKSSIDLVITDPPYEISRETNFHKGNANRKRHSYEFGEWDKITEEFTEDFIKTCYDKLKNSGVMYTFFDIHKINMITDIYKKVGFKQVKVLCWLKNNPLPANCKVTYVNAMEFFVYGVKKGSATFNIEGMHRGLFETPICQGKERTSHKTQKPLQLIDNLVQISSNEGDTVLDPFLGSGTTAVSSLNNNRNFIGIEKDWDYCMIANERIKEAKLQSRIKE